MKVKVLLAILTFSLSGVAQESDGDSILLSYEHTIDSLAQLRDAALESASSRASVIKMSPYYYRLMLPGTYYSRPLRSVMAVDWNPRDMNVDYTTEVEAATMASDEMLARLYVDNPSLVVRTESAMQDTPALREEVKNAPVSMSAKLAEKAVEVDLVADVPDTVAVVAKKPKFWKVSGTASLQFTQSYFSDNWYQGGENNYAGIGMLTLEANYDNKQKVQWDNKFEAQIGFQTTSSDVYHKIRVTSNLLRLTSKLGYKAAKNWFYTGQAMTYTQMAPYFEKNRRSWKARFATPLYFTLSVGMDYKYKSKNGKVDLSVYLSPLAYYMTYVGVNRMSSDSTYNTYPTTYGLKHADDHFLHKFGPNFTVNSKIVVCKNVTWTSRLYWFSNFHSTLIEWENTFDFTINKYLSAKFYAYPRFDDSSIAYRNAKKHRGTYLMFKEWLSLGLSYKF